MTRRHGPFSSAMLFDGKGSARDLSDAEVETWSKSDGVLWLDVDLTDNHARKWVVHDSGLDKTMSSILLAGETRPRSIIEPDGLIVVLRGINMNPGAVPDDMVAVRMLLQRNRIITSRRRKVLSIVDLRDALREGNGPKTGGGFLAALTTSLSTRIESAVENIEHMITEQDEKLTGNDIEHIRVALSIVRRQAAAIRRHLSPQRDAIDRLTRTPTDILSESDVLHLREEGDQLMRQVEDLDLARENALVTQEELMNRVALEQNSRMYLLSVVAAVFLPLTFVTGLLGMNVAGLPGTVNPNGFLYSALVMVLCLIGLVVYFRYRKWL